MNQLRIFAAAVAVLVAVSAQGTTINTSTIISAQNSFPGESLLIERGGDATTIVQMVDGGEAHQLQLRDDSVLNFSGGHVAHAVLAFDESVVNVLSGTLPSLSLRQSAIGNLYDGVVEGDILMSPNVGGIPTLNLLGGRARDIGGTSGVLNLHGGHFDWLRANNGVVNMTGGSIINMILSGEATVHWSGGELREGFLWMMEDTTLNVYGRGLYLNQDNHLFGTLLDGTIVHDEWIDQNDNSRVILHNVPEPNALALSTVCLAVAIYAQRGTKRLAL